MITYIAINLTNGKFYIGSTSNFEKRQKSHLTSKENYPFQNALRKNPESFYWVKAEDDLNDRSMEQYYLDYYFGSEQCYNLNPLAEVPPSQKGKGGPGHHLYGKVWDPDVISRRTAHCKGETNPVYGRRWWNDGKGNFLLSEEQPAEGWCLGGRKPPEGMFSGENNPMHGKTGELSPVFGSKWYNNGKEARKFKKDPGEGWVRGRGCWFNNGETEKFSVNCPAQGWKEGRLKRIN